MADEQPQTIRAIHWRDVFPFLNLFRAFRVAIHPSKLLLALTALILIYCGGRLLDWGWLDRYKPTVEEVYVLQASSPLSDDTTYFSTPVLRAERRGIFDVFLQHEVRQTERALYSAVSLRPYEAGDAIWRFLVVAPVWLWASHWLFALIFTAWFLLIWSIFGGAICRIAAVHVARDEKMSVRQSLRFSANKVLSFIFAPLIPLLIIFGIGLVLSVCGFVLFHIPVVGPIVAGVLFIFALLGGLVMTLVLLGTLGGLNLMYPTIGVEGSDSFDAISRSFSYVFARPWRMLWYTVVSLIYGAICYLFVRFFIFMVLLLTWFFVGWWLKSKNTAPWYPEMFPPPSWSQLAYEPGFAHLKWSEDIAAGCIAFWNYLAISMLGAFAISFYFSASTIIYYLLRREVDATELVDVYVEEADDDLADTGPVVPANVATVTTTSSGTVVVTPSATVTGSTSAPGGGVSGTAGSSPPGGSGGAGGQPYTAPATDNPAATGGNPTE
jgi:hypothetical protein